MITPQQIRDARRRGGYSQASLAKAVGVAQRTVGSWERGETTPGMAEPRLLDVLREHLEDDADTTTDRALSRASDVELLAEIARRFARTSSPVTGEERASEPAVLTPLEPTVKDVLAARAEREELAAARDTGMPTAKQRREAREPDPNVDPEGPEHGA